MEHTHTHSLENTESTTPRDKREMRIKKEIENLHRQLAILEEELSGLQHEEADAQTIGATERNILDTQKEIEILQIGVDHHSITPNSFKMSKKERKGR